MSNQRLIGAHVSASGGIHKAVERAADIGCNAVQVFSSSPRTWRRKPLESIDFEAFYTNQKKHAITTSVTHAIYLVNLASDKPESVQKSKDAIAYDLEFDSKIKGRGVVVHVGSHQGRGWDAVKDQVAATIADLLKNAPQDCHFLIENSAGQNGKLQSDLQEIRWLIDQIQDDRLGWCFDTCHAHAAGYGLGETSTGSRGNAIQTISELSLWDALKVVHVNDSRDPFDSGRDRHANLGDGEINQSDLAYFVNFSEVVDRQIPLILEVPGIDGNGPDAENVTRLSKMVK